MLKKLLVLFLVALATGCAATAVNVPICNRSNIATEEQPNSVTNKLGQLVMWDQNLFPLRVTIDPNIGEPRRQAVMKAIDIWNQETGQQVFMYVGDGDRTDDLGTIWITDKKLDKSPCGNQYYGLAYTYFLRSMLGFRTGISHAFIEFHVGVPNDRIGDTAIHELGHVLGLHHDPERTSIMFAYNHPGRMEITQEDIDYVIEMITGTRETFTRIDYIF